jgi:hypothetical protein
VLESFGFFPPCPEMLESSNTWAGLQSSPSRFFLPLILHNMILRNLILRSLILREKILVKSSERVQGSFIQGV